MPAKGQSGTKRQYSRHPWDAWLHPSNMGFVALRGRDWQGRVDSFVQAIRNQCSKRGLHVALSVSEDGDRVTVMFVKE